MRLRRNHHWQAFGGRDAGDSLAGAHARASGHLLDARSVRCAKDELVGALVVQIHKAGIRTKRVRNLPRNQGQDLLEIERRVDGFDRLGQQAEMTLPDVHPEIVAAGVRSAA